MAPSLLSFRGMFDYRIRIGRKKYKIEVRDRIEVDGRTVDVACDREQRQILLSRELHGDLRLLKLVEVVAAEVAEQLRESPNVEEVRCDQVAGMVIAELRRLGIVDINPEFLK